MAGVSGCKPVAFDLGFSSGMQQVDPLRSCADYSAYKLSWEDTGARCEAEGFAFIALTFEPHGGGFGPAAADLLHRLAKLHEASGSFASHGHSRRIAERVSSALQRAQALAILKRLSSDPVAAPPPVAELTARWEAR